MNSAIVSSSASSSSSSPLPPWVKLGVEHDFGSDGAGVWETEKGMEVGDKAEAGDQVRGKEFQIEHVRANVFWHHVYGAGRDPSGSPAF